MCELPGISGTPRSSVSQTTGDTAVSSNDNASTPRGSDPASVYPPPGEPQPTNSPVTEFLQLKQTRPSHSPSLDWTAAYPKCPIFRAPYQEAASKKGGVVQVKFQHRRHHFRFITPYLQICVNGIWLTCVPQFPEFLTRVLYEHHDHVTAEHRARRKHT